MYIAEHLAISKEKHIEPKTRKIKIEANQTSETTANVKIGKDRTATLTYATPTPVLRYPMFDEPYYEVLSIDSASMDMSRFQPGAPLLNSHNSDSVDDILGSVEKTWFEGNEARATVKISSEHEDVLNKIREGTIRNVSVGFSVQQFKDISKPGDKIRTLQAIKWRPHEVSLVAVPADPNSQIRKQNSSQTIEIEIESQKDNMSEQNKKSEILADRARTRKLRELGQEYSMSEAFVDSMIDEDITPEQAEIRMFKAAKTMQPTSEPISSVVRVDMRGDNETKRRDLVEEAFLRRMDSCNFKGSDASLELSGRSILQTAEFIFPRRLGENDTSYSKRAMSSSDLPFLLANVAEKSLQKKYQIAGQSYKQWTRSDSLRNYKEASQVKLAEAPNLAERKENAEFQYGYLSEEREVAQLKDYGIIVPFGSQMLVNDDLNGLEQFASSAGLSAARKENSLAYLALTNNKNMKDGLALYVAGHGNLGAASAINQSSIAEAYKLMRKQKSVGSLQNLNLSPAYFICGPDKEVEARQFFAAVNAQQTSNVNIFSGSMQVIVDADISGNQWYLAASPDVIDTVVVYTLEGNQGPKVESKIDFNTNSLLLKIDHACIAEPMDWRGLVKNAGA